MNNLYVQWCAANGKPVLDSYAFKCTAAASGNDQLPDLRGSSRSLAALQAAGQPAELLRETKQRMFAA